MNRHKSIVPMLSFFLHFFAVKHQIDWITFLNLIMIKWAEWSNRFCPQETIKDVIPSSRISISILMKRILHEEMIKSKVCIEYFSSISIMLWNASKNSFCSHVLTFQPRYSVRYKTRYNPTAIFKSLKGSVSINRALQHSQQSVRYR